MKEIRWHGRGGQGAVIAARVLASALDKEGKSAMAFPRFGPERRGAPVVAFTGFDVQPIREKCQLYSPDCLIVIDPHLMRVIDVFEGVKAGAALVLNSTDVAGERYHQDLGMAGIVDATAIGLAEIGRPITNTCMLGAFARTTDWVQLESVLLSLEEFFSGEALKKNVACVRRGYDETRVVQF